jgi:GTP-binding protein Era
MPSEGFRSGFISIIGRPNVGKSTLLNRILQEKIAIVSDKPQTTRNRIMGVKHLPAAQLVFLDTPGIHKPKFKLNQRMVETALSTLNEVDLILFMTESDAPGAGDQFILERLKGIKTPIFLVLNKIDKVKKEALIPLIDQWARLFPFTELIPISALTGDNVDRLIEVIVKHLPEGEPFFPEDTVTDQPLRFIAAEIVREKILARTYEEIPYSVAVEVEEFIEDTEKQRVSIRAVIYVERESQKGIVIGKGGEMLKAVGTEARLELERLIGTRVHLELWVKVKKDWRGDEAMLTQLGY